MMCKKLRNATRLFGLLSRAGIAQLCPTRGTRTPVNQYLGEGFKPSTFSLERLLKTLWRKLQRVFSFSYVGLSPSRYRGAIARLCPTSKTNKWVQSGLW